jgi:glucokinase|tara:strand:- start:1055 stop:1912 length:858 start_codon:yes stop_codon:yes gene_type:complete
MAELEKIKPKKIGGKKKIIAMDLGGTNLRIATVQNNKILEYYKEKTPRTSQGIKTRIFELIEDYITKDVKGIAIASPGPLKDGVIKNPPNLPLRNYNLKKELQKKFKVPVEVKNDADCVAHAELKLGCKRKNFIILTLGTGIGGGVIIDGKLYRGEGYAGELGHIILDNGKEFEELTASKRLHDVTTEAFGKPKLFHELMNMKGPKAKKIKNEFAEYYGQGIASLIHCFDPEAVILAGGIKECGSRFLTMIKKKASKYFYLPKKTPIVWSKIDHPGILGASLYLT